MSDFDLKEMLASFDARLMSAFGYQKPRTIEELFASIKRDLRISTWMMGANIVLTLVILWRLCVMHG
jgi:hypothetical protein